MAFVDEVVIRAISGAGGNGCISFRREKYVPRGGPDGGNGGAGGSIVLRSTRDKTSLLDFKFKPKFQADRGEHGMGSDCDGRGADDMVILLPVGTLVYSSETGELLADLNEEDMEFVAARGGRGGRGNRTFVSSTLRAPRIATPGEAGEVAELRLELRLLADVGLVGLPNAGKSSFLSVVSRARPKVAGYPFTTLQPHLGVVDHTDQSFVIADLPGLIEGASMGIGLGHQFLRHATRNRLLLHLVDMSEDIETIFENVRVIENELSAYGEELGEKEKVLVFTKADLLSAESLREKEHELAERFDEFFIVSSHSGYGMKPLLDFVSTRVQHAHLAELPPPPPELSAPENHVSP